jgi:hypothetical protein
MLANQALHIVRKVHGLVAYSTFGVSDVFCIGCHPLAASELGLSEVSISAINRQPWIPRKWYDISLISLISPC